MDQPTALDLITLGIAGVGVITGCLALGFQVASWLIQWRTRVQVEVGLYETFSPGQTSESIVLFQMTNQSAHRVKVTHVGFGPAEKGGPSLFIARPQPEHLPLPIEIEARDGASVWITQKEFEKHRRLDRPVVAQIATSDQKKFESKPTRLSDSLDTG